jgi:hypothetical protein
MSPSQSALFAGVATTDTALRVRLRGPTSAPVCGLQVYRFLPTATTEALLLLLALVRDLDVGGVNHRRASACLQHLQATAALA